MDNTLLRSFHDPLIYELHGRLMIVKGLISVISWSFSLEAAFIQKVSRTKNNMFSQIDSDRSDRI